MTRAPYCRIKTKTSANSTRLSRRSFLSNTSQGWRSIGYKVLYFRSKWEANYARYLDFLIKCHQIASWEHEPYTFWFENIKRGVRSYLPDFKIYRFDGSHYWVEVKGFYDSKSRTKIKRFKKYYPQEILYLVDGEWFKKNNKKLKGIIPEWETSNIKIIKRGVKNGGEESNKQKL